MNIKNPNIHGYIWAVCKLPSLQDYADKIDIILRSANFTDTCEPCLDKDMILNQNVTFVARLKTEVQELCKSLLDILHPTWESGVDKINNIKKQVDSIIGNWLIKRFIEHEEKWKEIERVLWQIKKLKFRENEKEEWYILALLTDWTTATLFKRNLQWTKISELKEKFKWVTLNQKNKEKWWKFIKDIRIEKNVDETKSWLLHLTFDFSEDIHG